MSGTGPVLDKIRYKLDYGPFRLYLRLTPTKAEKRSEKDYGRYSDFHLYFENCVYEIFENIKHTREGYGEGPVVA